MTTVARRRCSPSGNGRVTPESSVCRVAFYIRISTDEQHQKFSLPAQRERLEAFCKSQHGDDWQLHQVYRDTESGTHLRRPGLQAMRSDARDGRFDALLVFRVDRLSRKVGELARLADELTEYSVTLTSVTEPFDTSNPAGKAMLQMLGVFAEFEHGTIVERTRVGMARKARDGEWCGGRPPLGYDLIGGKLQVDREAAGRVVEVFRLYRRFGSILATVEELNRRGWTASTGRPFSTESVRRLLRSPVYIGKVVFGGEQLDGIHEPIVDEDTWGATQRLLSGGWGQKRQGRNPRTLLSGLLICGACGSPMHFHQATKGTRRYAYLVCRKARTEGSRACPGSRVAVADADSQVIAAIRGLGRNPMVITETTAAARRELETRGPELQERIRTLRTEVGDLNRKRTNLVTAIAEGKGARSLTNEVSRLDEALERARDEIEELEVEMADLRGRVIDESDLRAALAAFDAVWDHLAQRERRRVLGLLLDEVRFDPPSKRVSITAYSPLGIKVLADEVGDREASAGAFYRERSSPGSAGTRK